MGKYQTNAITEYYAKILDGTINETDGTEAPRSEKPLPIGTILEIHEVRIWAPAWEKESGEFAGCFESKTGNYVVTKITGHNGYKHMFEIVEIVTKEEDE